MRYSGDAYYEAAKLMDLKIQGTLGLTQRDVKAVSDIDGVELAEGSYSTDVMSGEDDARKVLHLGKFLNLRCHLHVEFAHPLFPLSISVLLLSDNGPSSFPSQAILVLFHISRP